MRVIRTGRKPQPPSTQWSDFEVLQAYWEMEEQMGIRENPLTKIPDDIPQLKLEPQKDFDDI